MSATPLPKLILVSCLLAGSAAFGQTAPSTGSPAPAAVAKPERVLSAEASDALAARVKYEPPPPLSAEPPPEPEADKPRNEIIRLPKYIVEGERPPVFSERTLYSKEQLQKLAAQRYLSDFHRGLNNRFRIGREDEAFAMMTYLEEERRANILATNDHVSLYRASGDTAKAEQVKEEAYSTFVRKPQVGAPKNPLFWTDPK